MQIFRIGDSRHAIWDGTGAALVGGRWNSQGRPVIYGSLSYACAMLEILVHANIGRIPDTQRFVVAEIPTEGANGIAVERHDASTLPAEWNANGSPSARLFGDQWLQQARTAVLLVPSVIATLEWNALVNPLHPDAAKIKVSESQRVVWDQRLFERPLVKVPT
jgi:RES domain-containing protein